MKYTKFLIPVAILSIFVVSGVAYGAWSEPACGPTGCNTETPINVGATTQTKAGSFVARALHSITPSTGTPTMSLSRSGGPSWSLFVSPVPVPGITVNDLVFNGSGAGGSGASVVFTNPIRINNSSPSAGKIFSTINSIGDGVWRTLTEICTNNPETCSGIGSDSFWGGSLTGNINNLNTGNVGIGVASPTAKIEIEQGSNGTGLLLKNTTGSAQQTIISTPASGSGVAQLLLRTGSGGSNSDWRVGTWTNNKGFYIYDGKAGVSRFTIDGTTGNIGLGITPGNVKLDINGGLRIREGGATSQGKFLASFDNTGKAFWGTLSEVCALPGSDCTGVGDSLWAGSLTGDINNSNSGKVTVGNSLVVNGTFLGMSTGWNSLLGSLVVGDSSSSGTADSIKLSRSSGGHPRITLTNDVGGDWSVDNNAGNFRIFRNGVVNMSLSGTDGRITLNSGTPANGKVLSATNAGGLADWKTIDETCAANPAGCLSVLSAALPTGVANDTLRHNGTSWIANSTLSNTGSAIGIGTNNPTTKLQLVNGNFSIVNANPRITLAGTSGNWNIDNSSNKFRIFQDGFERFNIQDGGQVEIKDQIQIRGGSPGANKLLVSNDSTGLATWKTGSEAGLGLPTGTANQTLRYDSSNNLVADSNLTNNGDKVVISPDGGEGTNLPYDLYVGDNGIISPKIKMPINGRAGRVVVSTDDLGTFSWDSPVAHARFIKKAPTTSFFGLITNYNSDFDKTSQSDSGIELTTQEPATGLFGLGEGRNMVQMSCGANREAVSGGIVCKDGKNITANGPGKTRSDWLVSCASNLNDIIAVSVTCAAN